MCLEWRWGGEVEAVATVCVQMYVYTDVSHPILCTLLLIIPFAQLLVLNFSCEEQLVRR